MVPDRGGKHNAGLTGPSQTAAQDARLTVSRLGAMFIHSRSDIIAKAPRNAQYL
jgi:hypothetical protein